MKYTVTNISKRWRISKAKLQVLLDDNNVAPIEEKPVEINSMIYLQRFTVSAKYYDSAVVEDLMKVFPKRT